MATHCIMWCSLWFWCLKLLMHFSCLSFSGDTDSVVPVTATRYSIDALKLPTVSKWYPWYDNGKVSSKPDHTIWCCSQIPQNQSYSDHFFFFFGFSVSFFAFLERRLVDGAKYTKAWLWWQSPGRGTRCPCISHDKPSSSSDPFWRTRQCLPKSWFFLERQNYLIYWRWKEKNNVCFTSSSSLRLELVRS